MKKVLVTNCRRCTAFRAPITCLRNFENEVFAQGMRSAMVRRDRDATTVKIARDHDFLCGLQGRAFVDKTDNIPIYAAISIVSWGMVPLSFLHNSVTGFMFGSLFGTAATVSALYLAIVRWKCPKQIEVPPS